MDKRKERRKPALRISFISLWLSSLFLFPGCHAGDKKDLPVSFSDLGKANSAFSELKKALHKEDGKLWNHSLEGPVMIAYTDTRIIIANEPDEQGALTQHGKVYIGIFPENRVIGNSTTEWSGKRWTIVQWPLPETMEERLRLLIHESFHCTQPEIGFDSLVQKPNDHLDTREGRIWLKLELEALKRALLSEDPIPHLRNALLFRLYRQHLFPGSEDTENSLEINEGIAEYTGSILCGMNDEALKKHYASEIDLLYTMPTFVRSFAYFAVPVYGYFMKQTKEYWNQDITKTTSLTDYITGFFNVSCTEADSVQIMEKAKAYSLDSIARIEDERESARQLRARKYREQFLQDHILVIPLERMEIAFNAKDAMPLDSFGTVYPNLKITDDWGILEVDSGGALVGREWNRVILSYPEQITDSIITGKSWRLKVNSSWKLGREGVRYILSRRSP